MQQVCSSSVCSGVEACGKRTSVQLTHACGNHNMQDFAAPPQGHSDLAGSGRACVPHQRRRQQRWPQQYHPPGKVCAGGRCSYIGGGLLIQVTSTVHCIAGTHACSCCCSSCACLWLVSALKPATSPLCAAQLPTFFPVFRSGQPGRLHGQRQLHRGGWSRQHRRVGQ